MERRCSADRRVSQVLSGTKDKSALRRTQCGQELARRTLVSLASAARLIAGYAPSGTRLLLANSFLATIPLGYLLVVLPLYLDRAGVEPAMIGLLYTASGAVSAVLVALSGILADRWGRRRFLLAGTLLPLPSYLVFAMTTDVRWLVVASLFGGVGLANGAAGALTVAGFDAMLAERAGDERRTRVFALSQ